MKKIVTVISVILIMMTSLCACAEKERVFLSTTTNGVANEKTNSFKNPKEYGIGMLTTSGKKYDELIGKSKKPFEKEETYTYKDSSYKKKNSKSDEAGTFYCVYDEYTGEHKYVKYIHGTDNMTYYFDSTVKDKESDSYPEKSDDELRKIAKQFFLSIMSEEQFSNYDEDSIIKDNMDDGYWVSYARYIEGYLTDDILHIWIKNNGEIRSYTGPCFGKYEEIKSDIKKNELDETKKILMEKMESVGLTNYVCDGAQIVTDTSGKIYLGLHYHYGDTESPYYEITYLAVE